MGYKVIETGKLSVDEKIKKETLIKPTPVEDKSEEKGGETVGTKDNEQDEKK